MKNSCIIFPAILLLAFAACRKEEKKPENPTYKNSVTATARQFNFRSNSKWHYKNIITNATDTMYVDYSSGYTESQSSVMLGEINEYYSVSIISSLLYSGWPDIDYTGSRYGISAPYPQSQTEVILGFPEKNAGDSVVYQNGTRWHKVENIHSSLTINGHTYSKVYEISYHPSWNGFAKIWWCPGVGFVKLAGSHPTTNQYGVWELENYNVSLH